MSDSGELAVRRSLGGSTLLLHPEPEDVPEGQEPGAGRGVMLVQTNSYDDIAAFLQTPAEAERKVVPARRSSSKPSDEENKEQEKAEKERGSDEGEDDTESADSIIERVGANIHRTTTIASIEVDEDDVPQQLPEGAEVQEEDDEDECITVGGATSCDETVSVSRSNSDSTTSPSNDASTDITYSTTPSTAPQSPSRARAVPPCLHTQSSITSEVFEGGPDSESCVRESWRKHRKHIFILSSAGKPIYTRYGDETDQASIIGVLQALFMSYQHSEDRDDDSLVCIVAGRHKFVFLFREPLLLACVSSGSEPTHQLKHQLLYAYYQIVFNLTSVRIESYFNQRTNYDLRRQLTGVDRFTDALMDSFDLDPSFLLSAVRCLALDGSVRDTVAQTIAQYCKIPGLIFAIVFAIDPEGNNSNNVSSNGASADASVFSSGSGNSDVYCGGNPLDGPINNSQGGMTDSTSSNANFSKSISGQLITIVRHRTQYLAPLDIHLLFNLVAVTGAFKGQENWVPVCLPKYNSRGYLYAHVSYLNEEFDTCLILLSLNSVDFDKMSRAKTQIQEKLTQLKCLDVISAAIQRGPYDIGSVDVPDMKHFVYKSRSTSLCTSPALGSPYQTIADQSRLMALYRYVHHYTHQPPTPVRLLLVRGVMETCVAWMTNGFEMYAVFETIVNKQDAISSLNRVMKWIKKEEDKLFVINALTIPGT